MHVKLTFKDYLYHYLIITCSKRRKNIYIYIYLFFRCRIEFYPKLNILFIDLGEIRGRRRVWAWRRWLLQAGEVEKPYRCANWVDSAPSVKEKEKEKRKTGVKSNSVRVGTFTNAAPPPPSHHESAASFPPLLISLSLPTPSAFRSAGLGLVGDRCPLAIAPPSEEEAPECGWRSSRTRSVLFDWFMVVSLPLWSWFSDMDPNAPSTVDFLIAIYFAVAFVAAHFFFDRFIFRVSFPSPCTLSTWHFRICWALGGDSRGAVACSSTWCKSLRIWSQYRLRKDFLFRCARIGSLLV